VAKKASIEELNMESKTVPVVVASTQDETVNIEKTTDLSSLPEPEIENSVNNQVSPI
jgi:hypothetical protein